MKKKKMRHIFFLMVMIYSINALLIPIHSITSNNTFKICANCQESFVSKDSEYKCKLFYNINIINGEKYYYTCKKSRMNNKLCGIEAKYYYYKSIFKPSK